MMQVIKALTEILFWLCIFVSPFITALIIALIVFGETGSYTWPFTIIACGILAGILFAERVRRSTGCSNFIARLFR